MIRIFLATILIRLALRILRPRTLGRAMVMAGLLALQKDVDGFKAHMMTGWEKA